MRLALKSTLSFLLVYLVIVGGVAWWMAIQLQSLASDVAESTTQLVGGEVARALSDSAVAQLVRADDDTRARLKQIVDLAAWMARWPGGEYDRALRPDGVHLTIAASRDSLAPWLAAELVRCSKARPTRVT